MRMELLLRGLSAQRRGALIWAIALFALTASVLAVWPSMNDSGALASLTDGMSPELVAALGIDSLASASGFLNGNLYAMLLPLLFAALGIMHTNALTAGDEDAGRLELLFSLPVSRAWAYLARFSAVALILAVLACLLAVTVQFGGATFGMRLTAAGVLAANLSVLLLALFHAALALAFAGAGLRSGVVLAASFGALVLGYLVYALLPMTDSLSGLARLSPWYWALHAQPLEHGFDGVGIALLLGGSAVLVAAGLVAVQHRTIRTP